MRFALPLSLILLSSVAITACDRFDMTPLFISSEDKLSLSHSVYGATDAMATQAKHTVTLNTVLVIGSVSEIGRPGLDTALGQQIKNTMSNRLVQLGYQVLDAAPEDGDYSQVTGDYTIISNDVLINLRITDMKKGRILAAADTRMKINNEVRDLIKIDELNDPEYRKPFGNFFTQGWAEDAPE